MPYLNNTNKDKTTLKTFTKFCFIASVATVSQGLQAKELLGLQMAIDYWDGSIKGQVRSDPFPDEDETSMLSGTLFWAAEFGVSDQRLVPYSVSIRHDVAGLPRVTYRNTPIESEGRSVLTRDVNFAGNTFVSGSNMQSTYDLSFEDISLFYTVLDNRWFNLDLGLTQRSIDGAIELRTDDIVVVDDGTGGTGGTGGTTDTGPTISRARIEKQPLLLFGKGDFKIPKTPLSLSSTWQYGKSSKDNFNDTEYSVAYSMEKRNYTFRLELGYKRTHFYTDDLGELGSTLKVRGRYLRLTFGL